MFKEELGIYEKRLERFLFRLQGSLKQKVGLFDVEYWNCGERIEFSERLSGSYQKISEGDYWGKDWETGWFKLTAEVPKNFKQLAGFIDFGGEGLIFSDAGVPLQGLTDGTVFHSKAKRQIYLINDCVVGDKIELWVEAAANQIIGCIDRLQTPDAEQESYRAHLAHAELVDIDPEVQQFYYDFNLLYSMYTVLPKESVRSSKIFRVMNQAVAIYADNAKNVFKAREILKETLAAPATASASNVTAVGHAHIDTAWLWEVKETIRKCGRTFSTQLDLMNRYPDYVFGASQPQHYVFTKEHYPEIYAQIKERVKEGRWEVQGGMWIEADCNIPSGESLIRQLIHGKNFFMDEFGIDVKNLWIPDVFGYSGNLPQFMKKAGIDYFLTQKMSWSKVNTFPHHTFNWQGIDSSKVITHFPPENTYNSQLQPETIIPGMERFKEKDILDDFICLFGIGDGGGGAQDSYIESGMRMKDTEGCPKVSFGSSASFFKTLDDKAELLHTWQGELYLDAHRGTLTTQALVKRMNRKLEFRLRELEMLFSCSDSQYPLEEFDALWKKLLINQFHDIIPGSSINEVYKVTHKEYDDMVEKCDELQKRITSQLTSENHECITSFNSLSCEYKGLVEVPENWNGVLFNGENLPVQKENGKGFISVTLQSLSFNVFFKSENTSANSANSNSQNVLENDFIRYEFNDNGDLISCFDKEENREIISKGEKGNLLSLYDDHPNNWDAWDVDMFYEESLLENAQCAKIENISGPVFQGLKITSSIGKSSIEQEILLSPQSKRLDFKSRVFWQEKHKMLRVSFPADLRNARAVYDIQYGYTERPAHRNTSWDSAKFECCGHKYADLSEPNYGVALLNDCKYGYKIHKNILDLNLLRSPSFPDAQADQGNHEFTYSLLPHKGDLVRSDVFAESANLNQPPVMLTGKMNNDTCVPCKVTGEDVRIEVVKKAEKEDCLIVRLVETKGCFSKTVLIAESAIKMIETDLMEWNEIESYAKNEISLTFSPFEIKTFKILNR